MVVKIQLPEQVGRELLDLPDRESFVRFAVTKALEERRAAQTPQDAESPRRGRRLSSSEVRELALPSPPNRDRELSWRRANQAMLRRQFRGQWVVLEGEQVIAHSTDAAEAVHEARSKGITMPFVFFVEGLPPGVVRAGL